MPFFPRASYFMAFLLGHGQKSKFLILFCLSFFPSSRRKLCCKFLCKFFTQISEHFLAYDLSWAPFSWSLWSGNFWKDLFLLQNLSTDDAKIGQRWWCQMWKRGQCLSQLVLTGAGLDGLLDCCDGNRVSGFSAITNTRKGS